MKAIFAVFLFWVCSVSISHARYRVSLLTCGVGEELYASFGHSAIRIIDSNAMTDKVYNYGMFNFGDPDFYVKFTRGKLLYYADEENFLSFISSYERDGRSIFEQVLNLDTTQTSKLLTALYENLKPEHKYYKYDFLFDNCSTRIRDLFLKCFGKDLVYSQQSSTSGLTFMQVLNSYLKEKHWERLGIDLMLCNKVNDTMSAFQTMFLPDGLMQGFDLATLQNKRLAQDAHALILDKQIPRSNTPNTPFYLIAIFSALLLVVGLRFKKKLMYIDVLLFLLSGLIGILFLFMWFATEHATTYRNFNLLWASPLLLLIAYGIGRNKNWLNKLAALNLFLGISGLIVFFVFKHYIPKEIIPFIILILFRLTIYAKPSAPVSQP